MVAIEIEKSDLLNLVGKKLTDEQIKEALFLLKCESSISDNAISYELNPDRPDMFCVEGLAMAVKGFLGIETGMPKYSIRDSKIKIRKENAKVRPFIAAAVIKNVKLTDQLVRSLMQIQEKLHATIGRDRRKVAIGVHDLKNIKPPFIYKDVEPEKISFIPLDETREMNLKEILKYHPKGKDFAHLLKGLEKYPIIIDSKDHVLSFPPIINGELTKITKKTKNIFIDVTGTDELAVNQALNILLCTIVERSGKIAGVKIDNKLCPNLEPRQMKLDIGQIDRLLGLELKEKEIAEILERMRYSVLKLKGGKIDILIPPFRTDILHAVDIIEDVAIGYGYNNIIPVLPKIATIGNISEKEKFCSKLRDLAIGLGFQEVVSFVLTNKENQFSKMALAEEKIVEIANPISSEYTCCRHWLLPSLIKILSANKHVDYPQKIFEIGDCIVLDSETDTETRTVRRLAITISYDNANLTEMKSVVETILKALGCNYTIKEYKHPSFIESRCGKISVGGKEIGFFGEIHPKVLNAWKLEKPVIAAELEIEKLID